MPLMNDRVSLKDTEENSLSGFPLRIIIRQIVMKYFYHAWFRCPQVVSLIHVTYSGFCHIKEGGYPGLKDVWSTDIMSAASKSYPLIFLHINILLASGTELC